MTEAIQKANLSITFDLQSQHDLSVFESLECTTRFFDSGDNAPDPQFDSQHKDAQDLKDQRTHCDYTPDPNGLTGQLRIKFGSRFWVNRMLKYQSLRHKGESCVRDSLLRLTATQDVYGIERGTGKAQCVLTILWRFEQTSPTEVGSMRWRAVDFSNCPTSVEQKWIKEEEHMVSKIDEYDNDNEEAMGGVVSVPMEGPLYHGMPLDFHHPHPAHHTYAVQSNHNHQPQLSLDILASMQPDLDHHSASAPTTATATDYSQQSLPSSMCHNQGAIASYSHDNEFNFDSGHITITGAFEPSINLSAYDSFASQSVELDGLHALSGLEHDSFASLGLAVGDNGELVSVPRSDSLHNPADMSNCYSTKPNWHHANLISSLETAAQQFDGYRGHEQASSGHEMLRGLEAYGQVGTQSEDLVAHGLHDAHVNVNPGLWNLQSPFHEDTGSGAMGVGIGIGDCRDKSNGVGLGMGVLDMIERDQRGRGY